MENYKVSVIIPVYNVENYIERCLESVIDQTYKNIEILIINDGSSDESIEKCKKIAMNDSRIKIINQENQGLSGARNTGIDMATGEYICFMDSDDWVEKDYIQSGIDIFKKTQVKLIVFGYFLSNDFKDEYTTKGWVDKNEKVISKEDAMQLLVEDMEINSHAWDKIYHKSLFDNIRFPVGKNYEDIFIMHEIFNKCENIAVTKQPKYHYYERIESIARNYKIKNIMDYFEAEFQRRDFIEKNYPQFLKIQNTKLMEILLSYYPKIKVSKNISKSDIQLSRKKIKEYTTIIKKFYNEQHTKFSESKFELMSRIYNFNAPLYKLVYPIGNLLFYKIKKSKYKERIKSYFYKNEDFEKKINKYKNKRKILLVGLPEYNNLGDIAIGYAECEFIEKNKSSKYVFLPITERCFEKYLKKIKNIVNSSDIIFLQGGGNFGDQYYDQERIRKKVLKNFKRNTIYLMPSTFYMKNKKNISKFLRKYNSRNFNIFFREKYSFEIAKDYIKNKMYVVPDIVLSLDYIKLNREKSGIGLCIRKDVERKISTEQEELIKETIYKFKNKVFIFDTINKKTNCFEDYEEIVKNIFNEIAQYELVITDRLHCMIFCAITGTPCIAIGNYNYKIKGVFEWIKDSGFIEFCEDITRIDSLIEQLLLKTNINSTINLSNQYIDLRKILN